EVFLGRPLAHSSAALGQEGLGHGIAEAVSRHQSHARAPEDGRTGGPRRRVLAVCMWLTSWGPGGLCGSAPSGDGLKARLHHGKRACALGVACMERGCRKIEEGEGWCEDQQMRC